jgi:hypothetical protein
MRYINDTYFEVKFLAKDIRDEYSLSEFEALDIATKIQYNEMFRAANEISHGDSNLPALPAIAVALGHNHKP